MLALAGLIGSPAVAQTRLFCRYTGVEITDCAERSAPPDREIRDAGCCLRRVFLPLAESTAGSGARGVMLHPAVLAFAAPALAPVLLRVRAEADEGHGGAGPPLFVQHRALLI